jgi:hypothetical protein
VENLCVFQGEQIGIKCLPATAVTSYFVWLYVLHSSLNSFLRGHVERFILKNSEIHIINTGQNFNLYQLQANLTLYQKGVYYSGIKGFNNLPPPQHKKFIF